MWSGVNAADYCIKGRPAFQRVSRGRQSPNRDGSPGSGRCSGYGRRVPESADPTGEKRELVPLLYLTGARVSNAAFRRSIEHGIDTPERERDRRLNRNVNVPSQVAPLPARRGSVLLPGLPVLPPNVERHVVPGGGTRTLSLDAGDELTLIDREGRQPCELVVFDASGHSDPGLIGATATGRPLGIQAILRSPEPSAKRVVDGLASRGLDIGRAAAVRCFGDESRAGESASFVANTPVTLVAGAPGGPMPVDAQCAPSDIVLYVRRETRTNDKPAHGPPPPLAEPLEDVNIQPGNARGYEVKAGQLIQIVDVKGRECTDFQAFSLRALDGGLERDIDPTTTRTLMGSIYPGPGLFSKYFTVDHEPLLEIVHDTCGRHDSFGLACAARFYEDMGYPGHANCSDNISAEAEQFGIRPRAGWPAINFFFNTMLDDSHAIGSDEPWSRPGDYVLLRALTDLVCFSTACPDDIDSSNGWNPTDIQVRVYDRNEDFRPSAGFRMTADADLQMTERTAFHECFAEHTRNFIEYNGYWLAQDFPAHGDDRRILGMPGARGGHGPVAASQVRGSRPRSAGAHAALRDPRHAKARARAGRLHRDVLRARRNDRRRHRLPARRRQLPVDRWKRSFRTLAARAGGEARARRVGQEIDRNSSRISRCRGRRVERFSSASSGRAPRGSPSPSSTGSGSRSRDFTTSTAWR